MRFLAFSNKISTVQKLVLSSSREQGNFREPRGLEAKSKDLIFEAKDFKMCPWERPQGQKCPEELQLWLMCYIIILHTIGITFILLHT